MRGTKGFLGVLIAVIATASMSACSAPARSKSLPPTAKRSPSHAQIQLASLPGAQMSGSGAGFKEIAAARGTGNRKIGVFQVQDHAKIVFQLSCEGRSQVTIDRIYVIGPCEHGDLIAAVTTTTTTSRLDLTIQAPPKVAWAIYVSQPIPAQKPQQPS